MTTALIVFTLFIVYALSIWGARQELVAENEKITDDNSELALTIYIPIWNTFATIIYLMATLAKATKDDINTEIEYNQRKNFRNDLKKYKHNNDKQNNHC